MLRASAVTAAMVKAFAIVMRFMVISFILERLPQVQVAQGLISAHLNRRNRSGGTITAESAFLKRR
jgi:hypothetical protein